jgi:AbrB family looped-hinge helix DNA binding protein
MILTTTMSSKGQVVIPQQLRHDLGLEPGVRLEVRKDAGGITLTPCSSGTASLEDVAGCLAVKGPARSVADMDRAVDRLFSGKRTR